MNPILIVDDEVEMRIAMSETLKHCGYPVELSHNANDALKKIEKNDYSLVITDMTMPKRSGLELLKDIKRLDSSKAVIMVTAYATVETAVEAMKHGAFDYVMKPFNFDTFTFVVERALTFREHTGPMTQGAAPAPKKSGGSESYKEIITQNQEMLNLLEVTRNISKAKAPVLIQSESGTGKELLARFIHLNSDRASKPFVAINCAALPETLLESELFGYKKGAFTGANTDHRGKFEQAHTGTILLDEISEMALPLQAKLLRVLQEYEIDKIGGERPISIDVRVIATTNREMLEMIESGKFREDLYFRLNVIPLVLPPLRDRKGDIHILVDHFLIKHARINGREKPVITQEAMDMFMHYNWRGNVRELENVVERALLLCNGKEIMPHNLLMHSQTGQGSLNADLAAAVSLNVSSSGPPAALPSASNASALGIEVGMSMKEAEKKLIFETLRETKGNRTKAAQMLGISIRTLRNKLNEYRADGEPFEFDSGE
ncbi:MAG: sigma-54-dependent Fis family transcriptional regulator [Deltaproteobacteria bacterium]|nr:sigma-54-dependent Fis family transcriptional regulator [Deltaproteobacteria bacterium]